MDMEEPNHKHATNTHVRWIYVGIGLLGAVSGAIYFFNFKLDGLVPVFTRKTSIHVYVSLFVLLSVLYLIGVALILKNKATIGQSKSLLGIILFFAIGFRLCLVPFEPVVLSKDMYRFIWDGRVQQNGINPYRYPPVAEELKNMRDKHNYPNIKITSFLNCGR